MNSIDFHNHLMPGVDDGAQTIEESVEAIEAFKQDGVVVIVTTPHLDASLTARPAELGVRLREFDRAFAQLQQCAAKCGGVRVERGVELLLDIPEPDLSDPRLRLGGGKFFLMEFPFMTVPPQSARVVRFLADSGYTPIIAHPERYQDFGSSIDLAAEWKHNGGFLQVNGGSLTGRYGAEPRRIAFELLRRGWVDYLCSDYHARGPALVAQYRAVLEDAGAIEQAYTLMSANPSRMLAGMPPIPVQPLYLRRTLWGRVRAIFT